MRLQLDRIGIRVRDFLQGSVRSEAALVDAIAARCTETDSGARNIEHILSLTLLPELSAEILARPADNRPVESICVSVEPRGSFQYRLQSMNVALSPRAIRVCADRPGDGLTKKAQHNNFTGFRFGNNSFGRVRGANALPLHGHWLT